MADRSYSIAERREIDTLQITCRLTPIVIISPDEMDTVLK